MKNILSIILLLFITSSCSEDYVELASGSNKDKSIHSRISSVEDYVNFFNPETENFILVEELRNLNGDIIENNMYSHSRNGAPVRLIFNSNDYSGDVISTGFYSFWNGSFTSENIFSGSSVSSSLDQNVIEISSNNNFQDDFIPSPIENLNISGSQNIIEAGTELTWDSSKSNQNGVVIGIEYSPFNQDDDQIADEYNENIQMFSTVSDTGSYIVRAEDLERFPAGANLTFYIGRAESIVKIDPSTNADLTVNFYTAVRADFQTLKQ